MHTETKPSFFVYKHVAVCGVTPSASPVVAAKPRYELLQEYDSDSDGYGQTRLRIRESDGSLREVSLSARARRLGMIDELIAYDASDVEKEDRTLPLLFSLKFDADGEALLIRYLCEDADPVAGFSALTMRELYQFARIETYLGGDHESFWVDYGFGDGNKAKAILNEAEDIYSQKQTETYVPDERSDSLEIATLLATGMDLETKSAAELRECRFSVDAKLLPFVYGALRKDLIGTKSVELKQIKARTDISYIQKAEQYKWLYQAMKERLTGDLIERERAVILSFKMEDGSKFSAVNALYVAGAAHLSPDVILRERAAMRTSEMDDEPKAAAVNALYVAGAAHLTAELISRERVAILASGMDDERKVAAVNALYVAGAAHLRSDLISSERVAILGSGMDNVRKAEAVKDLYLAGSVHLTREPIVSERDAILTSGMDDWSKAAAVHSLYLAVSAQLTAEMISSERVAIRAANINSKYKSSVIAYLDSLDTDVPIGLDVLS